MINIKKVFLICFSVIFFIFLIISNNKINLQYNILELNQKEELSSIDCFDMAQKNGLKISYDEFIMVCSVVQGETGGVDLHWSELVAGVVKNRVQSEEFPNTIYDVLSQDNQFDAINNYYNGIDINIITYQAVTNVFTNNAYYTMNNLNGAVYYCNPDILDSDISSWFENNLLKTYDAHYIINGYDYHHIFYK